MPDQTSKSSQRVLEPPERISEVLFGLIMVLTFTCSFSVARTGHGEIRHMLIGALGCNVAWGIIDGIFYLMSSLSEQGHGIATLRAVREAATPKKAYEVIADALEPVLVRVLTEKDFEVLRQRLHQLRVPAHPRLTKKNWRGALGVAWLVFLSTFPPTLPFLFFFRDARLALRVSNAIAIVMLFFLGYAYGSYAGHRPYGWAFSMIVLGGVMVSLTIALGG